MKDSGQRDTYHGTAVRDKRDGKGRFDLISPIALFRLARVYEDGAQGKGERNWEQGIPLGRFIDSAIRHLQQYLAGMRDEDHLAQAAWNIFGCIHTEDQILKGHLPDSLDDLPEPYTEGEFSNWDELKRTDSAGPPTRRFYIAASVRGPEGDAATPETMRQNIRTGVAYATALRKMFPHLEFYSPHEHEPLFQEAFQNGLITSGAILNQCFSIIRLCDAVLVCSDPAESAGVRAEIKEAEAHGIAVVHMWKHSPDTQPAVLTQMLERP
ncbi:MAG TPA: DUF5664 domain-containing protein [Anaerohalosphaeraceae bacterium]|mgnify:CR=1 FL=1|jgi:hypothetical protein|nr:DUF5664 domain-containing protein [Anaerohalosphaeraceae bacterium]